MTSIIYEKHFINALCYCQFLDKVKQRQSRCESSSRPQISAYFSPCHMLTSLATDTTTFIFQIWYQLLFGWEKYINKSRDYKENHFYDNFFVALEIDQKNIPVYR